MSEASPEPAPPSAEASAGAAAVVSDALFPEPQAVIENAMLNARSPDKMIVDFLFIMIFLLFHLFTISRQFTRDGRSREICGIYVIASNAIKNAIRNGTQAFASFNTGIFVMPLAT